MHTDIGKDRLYNSQPPGVDALALFAVDLRLHLIDQVGRLAIHLDGKVPARSIRLAQAARSERTGGAVLDAGMVNIVSAMAVDLVAGVAVQFLAVRADVNLLIGIKNEVRQRERGCLRFRSLAAMNAILETLLLGEARIAFSELDVGDVGINLFIATHCQALERMIVAIGSQLLALKIGFIFSDGDNVFFFAPASIGWRFS